MDPNFVGYAFRYPHTHLYSIAYSHADLYRIPNSDSRFSSLLLGNAKWVAALG
jgi:hypothetical protein